MINFEDVVSKNQKLTFKYLTITQQEIPHF